MSWLKKSSRRKNMFEKEQDTLVESDVAVETVTEVEENCGKPEEETAVVVENEPEAVVQEEEVFAEDDVAAEMSQSMAEIQEPADTEVAAEEEAVEQEDEEDMENDPVSFECFVESQPEEDNPKKFIVTVVGVVAAVVAVVGLVMVLCRKKK